MTQSRTYDDGLRTLGKITVAFGWLDYVTNKMLAELVGPEGSGWRSYWGGTSKLDRLRRAMGKLGEPAETVGLGYWIDQVEALNDERNDVLKRTRFLYSDLPEMPGLLIMKGDGKLPPVDLLSLANLVTRLDIATQEGWQIIVALRVSGVLQTPIEAEEEDEEEPVSSPSMGGGGRH